MIIQEYQCSGCNSIKELAVGNSEALDAFHLECGDCMIPMKRILSATKGYVKNTSTPTKW